ncbi:ankyrin repeat domain-containing protein [Candidatus Babeliales bacterium]|nr:ankyrin repeat domain-containing protein [Candidatus Babeliales bacterium]
MKINGAILGVIFCVLGGQVHPAFGPLKRVFPGLIRRSLAAQQSGGHKAVEEHYKKGQRVVTRVQRPEFQPFPPDYRTARQQSRWGFSSQQSSVRQELFRQQRRHFFLLPDLPSGEEWTDSDIFLLCVDFLLETSVESPERGERLRKTLEHFTTTPEVLNAKNYEGKTALMMFAENGKADLVTILLGAGADSEVRDSRGNAALHYASTVELVYALTSKGADINVQNNEGKTPLHCAAIAGNISVVEALLGWGADPFKQDNEKIWPLNYALKAQRDPLRETEKSVFDFTKKYEAIGIALKKRMTEIRRNYSRLC